MKFLKSLLGLDDKPKAGRSDSAKSAESKTAIKKLSASEQVLALDGKSDSELLALLNNSQYTRTIVAKTLASQISGSTINSADETLMLEIAGYAREDSSLELFKQRFKDVSVNDLSGKLHSAPDRSKGFIAQIIAPKLNEIADLQTLADEIKGRDKKAYRVLKERIENVKIGQAKEQENAEKIAHLFKEIKTLSEKTVDKEFRARFSHLKSELTKTRELLSSEQAASMASQLDACAELIRLDDEALLAERERQNKAEQIDDEREELITALASEAGRLVKIDADYEIAESQTRAVEIKEKWQSLAKVKKASKHLEQRWFETDRAITALQNRVQEHGDIQLQFDKAQSQRANGESATSADQQALSVLSDTLQVIPNELFDRNTDLMAINEWLEINAKEYKRKSAEQRETVRAMSELVKKGFGAARGGRVSQAFGIKRKLDDMAGKLDETPEGLSQKMIELSTEIEKLDDWQDSIIVPKKEALIADMQALNAQDITVEERHNRIKRLQRDWRELRQRPSESSDELWTRFKSASDEAYEPCKAHYGELDKEREANVARRYQLIDTIKSYADQYDWSSAVWKDVEQTIKTAKDEFHAIKPIARDVKKDVETRFNEALAPIKEKMDEAYEQAKSNKSRLVDQAKKLTEQKDLSIAIDQAKTLQTKWKEAGRTWVRADRELWTSFKESIDGVFLRLDEQREAENVEKSEELAKAHALQEKLNTILAMEGDELVRHRAQKDELILELDNIGELPYKKDKSTRRAIENTGSAIEEKIRKTHSDLSKDSLVKLLNIKRARDANSLDDVEAAKQVEALGSLPDGMKSKALKAIEANPSDAEHRLLCVRAEIATDEHSPEEDQALRTEFQMNLLQEGLGNNRDSVASQLEQLVLEWLHAAPADSALADRFENIVQSHY